MDDDESLNLDRLAGKKKKNKAPRETVRLEVELFEVHGNEFPEFDFCQLVKDKTGREDVFDDPLEESEEVQKLKQIAKRFEEKYAPKRDRHGRKILFGKPEDHLDLGMGYDSNDPFIDNSEAYDELLPSTLTTKHGGFYVNSGTLEFRSIDDDLPENSDEDDDDSLDSDSDEHISSKKVRLSENGENSPNSAGKNVSATKKKKGGTIPNLVSKRRKVDKQNEIKKKIITPNQKAGSLLVKNSRNILARKLKRTNLENNMASFSTHVDDVVSLVAKDATKKETANSCIESTINNMLEISLSQRGKLKNDKDISTIPKDTSKSASDLDTTDVSQGSKQTSEQSSEEANDGRFVGRPPTLAAQPRRTKTFVVPEDCKKIILKLQRVAKSTSTANEKNAFFEKSFNGLFTLIRERGFNQLQRSAIFNDIAARTGLAKMLVIGRYKRWLDSPQPIRSVPKPSTLKVAVTSANVAKKPISIENLLKKLLLEIDKVMPRLELEHVKATEAAAEKKLEIINNMSAPLQQKPKNVYTPRRKFEWTDEIKSIFGDIVKCSHGMFSKTSIVNTPANFEAYVFEHIVPLLLKCFPPLWMSARPVMKMFREVCPNHFPNVEGAYHVSTLPSTAAYGTLPSTTSQRTSSISGDSASTTEEANNHTGASSSATKTNFTIESVLSTMKTSSPVLSTKTSPIAQSTCPLKSVSSSNVIGTGDTTEKNKTSTEQSVATLGHAVNVISPPMQPNSSARSSISDAEIPLIKFERPIKYELPKYGATTSQTSTVMSTSENAKASPVFKVSDVREDFVRPTALNPTLASITVESSQPSNAAKSNEVFYAVCKKNSPVVVQQTVDKKRQEMLSKSATNTKTTKPNVIQPAAVANQPKVSISKETVSSTKTVGTASLAKTTSSVVTSGHNFKSPTLPNARSVVSSTANFGESNVVLTTSIKTEKPHLQIPTLTTSKPQSQQKTPPVTSSSVHEVRSEGNKSIVERQQQPSSVKATLERQQQASSSKPANLLSNIASEKYDNSMSQNLMSSILGLTASASTKPFDSSTTKATGDMTRVITGADADIYGKAVGGNRNSNGAFGGMSSPSFSSSGVVRQTSSTTQVRQMSPAAPESTKYQQNFLEQYSNWASKAARSSQPYVAYSTPNWDHMPTYSFSAVNVQQRQPTTTQAFQINYPQSFEQVRTGESLSPPYSNRVPRMAAIRDPNVQNVRQTNSASLNADNVRRTK